MKSFLEIFWPLSFFRPFFLFLLHFKCHISSVQFSRWSPGRKTPPKRTETRKDLLSSINSDGFAQFVSCFGSVGGSWRTLGIEPTTFHNTRSPLNILNVLYCNRIIQPFQSYEKMCCSSSKVSQFNTRFDITVLRKGTKSGHKC